jgi:hypothetical protein
MITHSPDNLAHEWADEVERQEVDIDWYYQNCPDLPIFLWKGDDLASFDLDPWGFMYELPYGPEEAKSNNWRIFVQKIDLKKRGLI